MYLCNINENIADIVIPVQGKDWIALFSAVAAIGTFALNYAYNKTNDKYKRQPVLVFEYRTGDGWYLNNIGQGPALNITIWFKGPKGDWKHFVRIPSMATDTDFQIIWLGHLNVYILGSTYSDYQGIKYTTTSQHDENSVKQGELINIPHGYEVPRHWNQSKIDDKSIVGFGPINS